MQEKYYRIPELVLRLQVSRETIMRWCNEGKFRGAYLKLGSRRLGWRIPESAVREVESKGSPGDVQEPVSVKLEADQSRHTAEQGTGEV